jgi:ribose 5-phosphate isomerase A
MQPLDAPWATAQRALDFVQDGQTLGLGSGRAAAAFVEVLGEQVRAGLRVRGVPTSVATAELATQAGVPLVTLAEAGELDIAFDGADEVAPNLDLIKGYGGALVREKVVAAASRCEVILVGHEKLVPVLGSRGVLPVEVIPFAAALCRRRLITLGLQPRLRTVEGRTFLSDGGHHILDCGVGPLADPRGLDAALRSIPGVVGTGLFLGIADCVLVGDDDGTVRELRRRDP